jgi:hypothetical protein
MCYTEANHGPIGNNWLIECQFVEHDITAGMWITHQQQLTGFNLSPSQRSDKTAELTLHRSEVKAYKRNLASSSPKLFVIVEENNSRSYSITASPRQAKQARELGFLVVSTDIPPEVAHWINNFIK